LGGSWRSTNRLLLWWLLLLGTNATAAHSSEELLLQQSPPLGEADTQHREVVPRRIDDLEYPIVPTLPPATPPPAAAPQADNNTIPDPNAVLPPVTEGNTAPTPSAPSESTPPPVEAGGPPATVDNNIAPTPSESTPPPVTAAVPTAPSAPPVQVAVPTTPPPVTPPPVTKPTAPPVISPPIQAPVMPPNDDNVDEDPCEIAISCSSCNELAPTVEVEEGFKSTCWWKNGVCQVVSKQAHAAGESMCGDNNLVPPIHTKPPGGIDESDTEWMDDNGGGSFVLRALGLLLIVGVLVVLARKLLNARPGAMIGTGHAHGKYQGVYVIRFFPPGSNIWLSRRLLFD
jgi:hypothetical protein